MNYLASRYRQAVAAFARWVVHHPGQALALALVAILALGYGARFIGFTPDYRAFFGKDNPQLQAFNESRAVYAPGDFTVFAIQTRAGGADSALTPRVLEAARRLTADAWKLPYAMRVDSVTNFQHTTAAGDDLQVQALLPDDVAITPERIAHLKRVALAEPLLYKRLVAPAGDVLLVAVDTTMPQRSLQELPDHIAAARALRDRMLADYPELHIGMTGTNLMSISFPEASIHDSMTLIPLMYVVIFAIIWLMLRSGIATAATALVILFSTLAAIGVAGYMGILLTPPSMLAPLIITTLAVADSVHVSVAMFALMREGMGKHEALVRSITGNFTPIMLTGLTTAVGFLTINFSDSPPLRDLGNITAIGVGFASLWSVLLLPALLAVLKVSAPPQGTSRLEHLMGALGDRVLQHRGKMLTGSLAVALLLSAGIFRNAPDDNFFHYFDENIAFRSDTDRILERDVSVGLFADFSLRTGETNGITDPEVLRKIEAFSQWWKTQPEVGHVGSVTNLFKRLNKSMHGDDPAWYRLPEERELAAQYLLLYEMSLPFGLDLNNQINVDKSSTRVSVGFQGISADDLLVKVAQGEAWLKQNAPELEVSVSSAPVLFAHISERNIASMIPQTVVMFFVMALILIVTLRSARFGLLSLVTLALPVGITFGIWGYVSGEINFTMAILIGVVTGICDDDTVHFLNEYLHFRREGRLGPEEALRRTFRSSGVALLVTTAVLVAGFLVMSLSSFLPNNGMSVLASIAFVAALVLNLLLLPPLILLIDRQQRQEPEAGEENDPVVQTT
jgi:predicted RND superfamily exporter protein